MKRNNKHHQKYQHGQPFVSTAGNCGMTQSKRERVRERETTIEEVKEWGQRDRKRMVAEGHGERKDLESHR